MSAKVKFNFKAVKKYVKKAINEEEELKLFVQGAGSAEGTVATDNNGSVELVSSMAQGLTNATRVGDEIKMKRMVMRYQALPFNDLTAVGSTPNAAATLFRVLMVMDHDNIGTVPTIAQIFNATNPQSEINIDAQIAKRFSVLYDKLHYMPPIHKLAGSVAVAPNGPYPPTLTFLPNSYVNVKKVIKRSAKLAFEGPANTDNTKNSIYMVYLSNQVTARAPFIDVKASLYFTDN